MHLSNSAMFEDALGWRAIHIEASPVNYLKLSAARPNALNIHTAVCERPQLVNFVGDGVSSVSGLWEFMSDDFKEAWYSQGPHKTSRDESGKWSLPDNARSLPCRPIASVLELFAVSHVDLWMLDVEGAEHAVLRSFDFSRVKVDVIGIETKSGDIDAGDEISRILVAAGFALDATNLLRSDWWVRRSSGISSRLSEIGSTALSTVCARFGDIDAACIAGRENKNNSIVQLIERTTMFSHNRGPCWKTDPAKAAQGICT